MMGEPQFFGLRAGSNLLGFFWILDFGRDRVGQNLLRARKRIGIYVFAGIEPI